MSKLMNRREVASLLNVNERTLDRWAKVGRFPAPIRLGPKTYRWRAVDVEQALADLAQA
jgi:excisionase family DNA binding protein